MVLPPGEAQVGATQHQVDQVRELNSLNSSPTQTPQNRECGFVRAQSAAATAAIRIPSSSDSTSRANQPSEAAQVATATAPVAPRSLSIAITNTAATNDTTHDDLDHCSNDATTMIPLPTSVKHVRRSIPKPDIPSSLLLVGSP